MRKIKNLVFDLGGVLIEISLQGSVEAFKAIGFKDVEQYLNAYTQKGIIGDVEAGNISDEEFRQQVSRHVGHEVSWEDCQRGWLGFMTEVKQANLDQLLKFKTMGYKIALLSNTNPFIAAGSIPMNLMAEDIVSMISFLVSINISVLSREAWSREARALRPY